MIIGIPRESHAGETRVAATPQTVGQLLKLGYSVTVESGAGAASSFADAAYLEAGSQYRQFRGGTVLRRRAQGQRAVGR